MTALPYAVRWGYSANLEIRAASFSLALPVAIALLRCDQVRQGYAVQLVNVDKLDGSDDGNPDGLTEAEREIWESFE